MIFSVTRYLELHNAYLFTIDAAFYEVNLLMFYNVQTTNLTFVGNIWDTQSTDIALRNSPIINDTQYNI